MLEHNIVVYAYIKRSIISMSINNAFDEWETSKTCETHAYLAYAKTGKNRQRNVENNTLHHRASDDNSMSTAKKKLKHTSMRSPCLCSDKVDSFRVLLHFLFREKCYPVISLFQPNTLSVTFWTRSNSFQMFKNKQLCVVKLLRSVYESIA